MGAFLLYNVEIWDIIKTSSNKGGEEYGLFRKTIKTT
nr:MAG TPA: hypothetical protein [Caudoviricetes sp.]